eukprot:757759-Pelagomonas_calceolata.AAC.3
MPSCCFCLILSLVTCSRDGCKGGRAEHLFHNMEGFGKRLKRQYLQAQKEREPRCRHQNQGLQAFPPGCPE